MPVDEHGVAEGQEAVTLGEGQIVAVPPAGAHERVQHDEQGGPGQMEVGEQQINHLEVERAANVQVGTT